MPSRRKSRLRPALTAGAKLVSVAAGMASGGPGAISGVAEAAQMVFDAFAARQRARGDRMLRAAFAASDEEFPRIVREKLEDEHVCAALLEAMRASLEALSDEVMPAIGGLIREYEKENRRPDRFFRGCCRLLQDLSGEEFASFAALIRCIDSSHWSESSIARVSLAESRDEWASAAKGAPTGEEFLIVSAESSGESGGSLAAVGANPRHRSHLFHLLDRENLGQWHVEGRDGFKRYLTMDVRTARRIARIL